jgi:hypothetical protein
MKCRREFVAGSGVGDFGLNLPFDLFSPFLALQCFKIRRGIRPSATAADAHAAPPMHLSTVSSSLRRLLLLVHP